MAHLNIEFKALCPNHETIRKILREKKAKFTGTDRQIDTYFNTPKGRLKLREGNIENHLIFYERHNTAQEKESHVMLHPTPESASLKELLSKAFGLLAVVDKKREIYWVENVKIHLDNVESLGSFLEVEAIDYDGSIGKEKLVEQCAEFKKLFEVSEDQLISGSYSDLILNKV